MIEVIEDSKNRDFVIYDVENPIYDNEYNMMKTMGTMDFWYVKCQENLISLLRSTMVVHFYNWVGFWHCSSLHRLQ